MGAEFTSPGISQAAICAIKYAEPWMNISSEEYNTLKFQCAEEALQRVETGFPGFRSHIEEIEIATPITFMRYIGTPGGAIYGFDQYAKDSNYFISPKSSVKGLYLAGAWAGDGGFQPSLLSGGSAAEAILKEYRKKGAV
jgi:prolycopene isomerase